MWGPACVYWYLDLEKMGDFLVVLHLAEALESFQCGKGKHANSVDYNIIIHAGSTHSPPLFLPSNPGTGRLPRLAPENAVHLRWTAHHQRQGYLRKKSTSLPMQEFLEDCEAFSDVTTRIENYLLKNPKCTVAHLQCFYKLKEMRMVAIPFKHNLHRKYHRFISTAQNIRN